MTSEVDFQILANINGKAYVITGNITLAEVTTGPTLAPEFTEKLQHVALGYWSDDQQTLIFLLVGDDNALHAWSQNSGNSVAQKIPYSVATTNQTGTINSNNTITGL